MQLHTYVMDRLNRWVVWCLWEADLLTPAPGPRSVRSSWYLWLSQGRRNSVEAVVDRRPCPVDVVECGITDLCVKQLPSKLRDAVVIGYLSGGTAEKKAEQLVCDRATYFRRLDRAYVELLGLFNDHEAGVLRVDVDQANSDMAARAALTATQSLTECDSGPRIRATLV